MQEIVSHDYPVSQVIEYIEYVQEVHMRRSGRAEMRGGEYKCVGAIAWASR